MQPNNRSVISNEVRDLGLTELPQKTFVKNCHRPKTKTPLTAALPAAFNRVPKKS
jgi:hypothetical protein